MHKQKRIQDKQFFLIDEESVSLQNQELTNNVLGDYMKLQNEFIGQELNGIKFKLKYYFIN